MQSFDRSLFSSFVKCATQGGATVLRKGTPEYDAYRQETSRRAKANELAAKQRTGIQSFDSYLGDAGDLGSATNPNPHVLKNQYNRAWETYVNNGHLRVLRGELSEDEWNKERNETLQAINERQRNAVNSYLGDFNNGDYTDSNRKAIQGQNIRKYSKNPALHFSHGIVNDKTTYGDLSQDNMNTQPRPTRQPAQQTAQRPTRQPAQRPVQQTVPAAQAQQQTQQPAQAAKSPSNAIKFRGGYTVNADPSKVDWSDPGVTNINVGGVFMSQQQHDFYKNMQGQLYRSYMTQGRMSPDKARALSSKLTLQYMGDQSTIAAGGEAANRWQYRDKKPAQAQQADQQQTQQPAQDPQQTQQPAQDQRPAWTNESYDYKRPAELEAIMPSDDQSTAQQTDPQRPAWTNESYDYKRPTELEDMMPYNDQYPVQAQQQTQQTAQVQQQQRPDWTNESYDYKSPAAQLPSGTMTDNRQTTAVTSAPFQPDIEGKPAGQVPPNK